MTLDGLERVVRVAVPRRSRVNFVRYSDDFIITGKSKCLLEKQVQPAVEAFLAERGLTLSEEKTSITHIKHGFTFLGKTFRKHGHVLHSLRLQRAFALCYGRWEPCAVHTLAHRCRP
jgi:RNA-directed DNA polymerase